MKKIFVILIVLFSFIPKVLASSASIKVSSNSKNVIVGSTVKVSTRVSSSDLGSWEYCISYDSSILKLVSSTADANTCVKAGVVASKGQTSSTETFTFKAIKDGTSKVSVKSYAVYGYSTEEQMNTSASSITISTMTQSQLESTYSKDANLKSLSVNKGILSPQFNKDTLKYNVEVDNDVSSIKISATKNESHAKVTGVGEHNLREGNNTFEIKVTAQKGNSKTYTINVLRKELNPISIEIDNKTYTLVRTSNELPTYKTFTSKTIDYENEMIPALYSEITDTTLIGVKDENGNVLTFIYDNVIGDEYYEVSSSSISIFPLKLEDNKNLSDYSKTKIVFNNKEIEARKFNNNQVIIYALNVETGDKSYYLYDLEESNIIKYYIETKNYSPNSVNVKKYKIIIYVLIGVIILLLIILIVVGTKKQQKISL